MRVLRRIRRRHGLLAFSAALSIAGSSALARDESIYLDLRKALSSSEFKSALGDDIVFFVRGDPTPAVEMELLTIPMTSTTSRGRPSEQNCLAMLLRALAAMRDSARRQGGNAVIDLASNYGGEIPADASVVDCKHGRQVSARVVLRGTVARLSR